MSTLDRRPPARLRFIRPALLLVVLAVTVLDAGRLAPPTRAQDDPGKAMLTEENRRVQAMTTAADRVEGFAPPPPPAAAALAAVPGPCSPETAIRRIDVVDSPGLEAALSDARPGDTIVLADGIYTGTFGSTVSGTGAQPITLCGTRSAILTTGDIQVGAGFHLEADHWQLSGFTVEVARFGLLLEGADDTRITQVAVRSIGEEGITLRRGSSRNVITYAHVEDVGRYQSAAATGISIGTTSQNWCTYSACEPDRANDNQVTQSVVGPGIARGGVIVREGTTGTAVLGTTFFDSPAGVEGYGWVTVSGNGARVVGNTGITSEDISSQSDAFRTEDDLPANVAVEWGRGNLFTANVVEDKIERLVTPFRARHDDQVTLVLPRRAVAYTLGELVARFPMTFGVPANDVILVREHVLLNHQGHLIISADQAREIRLVSDASGFTSIVGFRGEIDIVGRDRLTITSWDPSIGGPDTYSADGRSYILVRASRMDIAGTTFTHLGFGIGQTSGVAWKGFADDRSTGVVTGSQFVANYFGAYTYEAVAMRWTGNEFAGNEVYGFDPHDYSNEFVFERNSAHDNGSHGIIFSRGCDRNVIRHNVSYDNAGHGIMLDDGKVLAGANVDVRYAVAVPSNDNVVTNNAVWGNNVGIALQGGSGNEVRLNAITGNRYGVRLDTDASRNTLASNAIAGNEKFGIFVFAGSAQNRIVGNTIRGGTGGVVLREAPGNLIARNDIGEITGRGIALTGQVQESHVSGNVIAGQGSRAVDITTAVPNSVTFSENQTGAWQYPRHTTTVERIVRRVFYNPAIMLWALIFGLPLVALIPGRRRLRQLQGHVSGGR